MTRRRNLPNGTEDQNGDDSGETSASTSFVNGLFHMSGRTRRLMILLACMSVAFYFLNNKEQQILDESHYTDARKQYLKEGNRRHERYTGVQHYTRPKGPTGKFILRPENEFIPAIAWLMSFPNSGTSFTMTMVARASNRSFATNYGDEVTAKDEPDSLSIYPRRPEGPYWSGYSGKINTPRDLPDKYVITKTHCGSRCINCGPDQYIETPFMFLRRCSQGHARLTPGGVRRKYDVEYPPERVQKAIHLIRNPLHNIIARYHLEHRHANYKNKTNWLDEHQNDADGLQAWCKDFDKTYAEADKEYFQDNIPTAICHGEFFKWTQWHNLVHEGLALINHPVPLLTVYYEDYASNFNKTAMRILEFLELDLVGELREFTARSDYDGYFTDEQVKDIRDLIKDVASDKTWKEVKHYFGE
ncbi:sulfotransferase family protein [Nitzschia inconspicua]|uniref:Sulfotransferase family protein n=1 Tax=Nitzschia inconspicua TaxID=303405 RepID=A0A9K3PNL1_9STRA|nr:sulfotransferase family protein [Nitzschia inconspicua]